MAAKKPQHDVLQENLARALEIIAKAEKIWNDRLQASNGETIEVKVSRVFTYKGQEQGPVAEKNETIAVRNFFVPPAEVRYSNGATVNLGNFEGVRVDVGLRVPCYLEEVDDAFVWSREWVESKLKHEVADARMMHVRTKEHPF